MFCALWLSAASAAQPLEKVLARMDDAAKSFQSLTGKVQKITYTAVIKDKSVESGSVLLKRAKPRDLRMLIQFTEPDEKSVAFQGRKAQIYYPKIQTVQEYDLGKHRNLVDQFLLLGFGTPGSELSRSYSIKMLGEEKVAGQTAARMLLVPKSEQAREHLKEVELWVADATGQPVQQKFVQPSGDYTQITYQEIKLNPNLKDDELKLKLPKGVKKEYPQK